MKAPYRSAWVIATSLLLAPASAAETTVTPPVAKKVEHREVRHGQEVFDEYFWLREKSNPEVLEYLNAENAYTDSMTQDQQDLEETIYQEMVSRIKQTDMSVPTRRGTHYYYSRIAEGQQYSVECRRQGSMDAAEQVLLDENELAEGHEFFALGSHIVSPDEQLLAYTTDTTGFRQYTLHVKDLRTGELLADTAERVTGVQWAADNRTLLWTTEDPMSKRSNQLWRRVLGSDQAELVYEEKDELFSVRLRLTSDKRFLLVQIASADSSEIRTLSVDRPAEEPRVLFAREPGHRYRVDHRDGQFYVVTNLNAKNYRIVTVPSDGETGCSLAEASCQEFVPHRPGVLVQSIDLYKDFAVVSERSDALNRIRTYDFRSGEWREVSFPEPVYAAFAAANGEFDETSFRYSYQSLVTPSSVFSYDVRAQQATLVKQREIQGSYDPSQYVSERLWVKARDGVRVPISIVYKKGLVRDGRTPLLLYAYGSYGAGLSPTFSSERLSLLERGMAFAIAHVRGGNELGEPWRDAGMLFNKKNTFNDFIDCAEYLIKQRWTAPERLCAEGYSAGGLLMGAAVNMRPDLFCAVHVGVPFVDVMNTMMDPSLPLTTGEYLVWGNPNDKAAYDYMLSYSPYDNLAERDYPAMLVTGSYNDSQVMYWEPAKYVARLRTRKTDANPLLLKTNMGAGHSGASGRYDKLREEAFRFAWMLTQVGIEE